MFNADTASNDPALDELGFAPLASHIARGIASLTPKEGIVVALKGGWGCGKTTTLNYIKYYFRKLVPNLEPIDFNPWWYSGHADLVLRLFHAIISQSTITSQVKTDLENAFSRLAEAVNNSPNELLAKRTGYSIDINNIPTFREESFVAEKNIPLLKEQIKLLITQNDLRFFVIIDDVDRLSAEEIRDLFKAIKAIGDLPNVVYLLALDPEVTAKALDRYFPEKGNNYLEKMIQVSFDLPAVNQEVLSEMLMKGLENLLNQNNILDFNLEQFTYLHRLGLRHQLKSPRKVIRLLNVLGVTIPAVAGEVDLSDFIALECCRLYEQDLYQTIRSNKGFFSGTANNRDGSREDSNLKAFHESWLKREDFQRQKWIKEFLQELFPKLKWVWNNIGQSDSFQTNWRKQLKVCSPEIFDIYFTFSLPLQTISTTELNRFIFDDDTDEIREYFSRKARSTDVADKKLLWNLIDRLRDSVSSDITPPRAEMLFALLVETWTEYIDPFESNWNNTWHPNNYYTVFGLLYELLIRVQAPNRFGLLMNVLDKPFSLVLLSRIVHRLAVSFGKFKNEAISTDEQLISETEFHDFTTYFIEKVEQSLAAEELQNVDNICKFLVIVFELDSGRLSNIVEILLKSDHGIMAIVTYGLTTIQSATTQKVEIKYEIDLKKIEVLIDPLKLVGPVKEIIKSHQVDMETILMLEEFIKEIDRYNQRFQQG